MTPKKKNKKYKITPLTWLIKDEASVKFHVQSDDYFGTLATILSLIKQQIKKDGRPKADALISLDNLEKDLLLLQKKYYIEQRAPQLHTFQLSSGGPAKIIKALKPKTKTRRRKAS